MNTTDTIIYEQPLNEQIRICLRLEHLFEQLQDLVDDDKISSSRHAMATLLKTLEVVNRPDLKAKLTQTLIQLTTTLTQRKTRPQVDKQKLEMILHDLDQKNSILQKIPNKIGENLRNNHFLKQIQTHLNNPGGACNFSSPAYTLWLKQPSEQRTHDLKLWAEEFNQLELVIQLILQLIRNSAPSQHLASPGERYQTPLNPNQSCQMVRVSIPLNFKIYPEISVGKHRLSIRFKHLNQLNSKSFGLPEKIPFYLSFCRL